MQLGIILTNKLVYGNWKDGCMWGSDLIAETIVELGFEFAALNPGASYRGLHDSFVNHLEDGQLPLVVCLHEEHAVAVAHGWTKVTGRPALAIVHSNVGLMHAVMAIYNAWCDRAPVVVLNATGTLDATLRRPWIEWIHTSQDHGALVRPFTKWDDQPNSAEAATAALAEASLIAAMEPKGPTFVCLDVTYQESWIETNRSPSRKILAAPATVVPNAETVREVAEQLAGNTRVVILAGRVGRSEEAWKARTELAERLGAAVITDIKNAGAFATSHPNTIDGPGFACTPRQNEILDQADAIVALDWIDLDNTLKTAGANAYVVSASLDPVAARGWVKNTFAQPTVDVQIPIAADRLVSALLEKIEGRPRHNDRWWTGTDPENAPATIPPTSSLSDRPVYREIAGALASLREKVPCTVTRYPLGWPSDLVEIDGPLDYIGRDGGEGLASGPGIAVGAALALKGSGRLAVAIIGDGDFAMGMSALWTAANLDLPLLIVVAANGVYGNDVVHQERIALERGRPVERKWIGQRLDEPRIDIAAIARAQGFEHAVRTAPKDIATALAAAAAHAVAGRPALVEIEMTAR